MELTPINKIRSISLVHANTVPRMIAVAKMPYEEKQICAIEVSDDDFFEKYKFKRYQVFVFINKDKPKWLWQTFDIREGSGITVNETYFYPDGTEEYILQNEGN